jgi:hypothetical protein
MDSRQQSAGMTKGEQLCPESFIEGLLLCIKTKKIERRLIQMRKKLVKILSSNYLTSTAMIQFMYTAVGEAFIEYIAQC